MDWKRKLTSRKFWLAVCGLVAGLLMAFRVDADTVNEVTGCIMAAASVVAYIIGEGLADAASVEQTYYIPETVSTPEWDEESDDE